MLSTAVNEAEEVLLLTKERLSRICPLRHGDPPKVPESSARSPAQRMVNRTTRRELAKGASVKSRLMTGTGEQTRTFVKSQAVPYSLSA